MGIEYQLEPTEEQKTLYHKMIDWGADIIFWRASTSSWTCWNCWKRWWQKLIIYSMGNFSQINALKPCKMRKMPNGRSGGGVLTTIKKKRWQDKDWNGQSASYLGKSNTQRLFTSRRLSALLLYQTYIQRTSSREAVTVTSWTRRPRIHFWAYKEMNEHVGLKW